MRVFLYLIVFHLKTVGHLATLATIPFLIVITDLDFNFVCFTADNPTFDVTALIFDPDQLAITKQLTHAFKFGPVHNLLLRGGQMLATL
jgi:hypothetical protein